MSNGDKSDKSDKRNPPTLSSIAAVAGYVEALLEIVESSGTDPRWAAIARTDFQKAFMSLRAASHAKGRNL